MSYSLYDRKGIQGQFASNNGYSEFVQFMDGIQDAPLTKQLIQQGWTPYPAATASELKNVMSRYQPPEAVQSTIDGLLGLLSKANEIAVIQ